MSERVLSVKLPDGRQEAIHIWPGSDPAELAQQFCNKHGISDPKRLRAIEQNIVAIRTPAAPSGPPKQHRPAPRRVSGPSAGPLASSGLLRGPSNFQALLAEKIFASRCKDLGVQESSHAVNHHHSSPPDS